MSEFARRATGRIRLLGWSIVLGALSLPAGMVAYLLLPVGLSLLILGVGVPLLLVAGYAGRHLAELHRRIFARAVGVVIPRPYRPAPSGPAARRALAAMRDPATWRDQLWLAVNGMLGLLVYTVAGGLLLGALYYASLPLVWELLPEPARTEVAAGRAGAWLGLPLAAACGLLWWLVAPPLVRGYARLSARLLGPSRASRLAERAVELAESRADTLEHLAAHLRRIERDLHDGAQARLVSLGLTLGMAKRLLRSDPAAAEPLLAEAHRDSGRALSELRDLVRGIHPPVLADRGLSAAVQALAASHPVAVAVVDELPARLPAPVESAVYFAVAEVLANVAKHSGASQARAELSHDGQRLAVAVTDNGAGGAVVTAGGGLHGIAERLAAFDGTVHVTSPPGGPTVVRMEVPCGSS